MNETAWLVWAGVAVVLIALWLAFEDYPEWWDVPAILLWPMSLAFLAALFTVDAMRRQFYGR